VMVIAVPVPMRVLNPVEMFVHVKVEFVSIVGDAHRRTFCYFVPAALSSRARARKAAGLKTKRALDANRMRLRKMPFRAHAADTPNLVV